MKKSALLFVLKGTSSIAKHVQTRPAFQTQIGLSKSHSKPSPYCKRMRGDTSHRYLDLTRKREKEKREEEGTDVEYCDISFGVPFFGGEACLKGQLFCQLNCHEV